MGWPNLKTGEVKYTPNQCTELNDTVFGCIKLGNLYYVQQRIVKDGKVTTCTQPATYASAALAKTAINLQTAAYIDSL